MNTEEQQYIEAYRHVYQDMQVARDLRLSLFRAYLAKHFPDVVCQVTAQGWESLDLDVEILSPVSQEVRIALIRSLDDYVEKLRETALGVFDKPL